MDQVDSYTGCSFYIRDLPTDKQILVNKRSLGLFERFTGFAEEIASDVCEVSRLTLNVDARAVSWVG